MSIPYKFNSASAAPVDPCRIRLGLGQLKLALEQSGSVDMVASGTPNHTNQWLER